MHLMLCMGMGSAAAAGGVCLVGVSHHAHYTFCRGHVVHSVQSLQQGIQGESAAGSGQKERIRGCLLSYKELFWTLGSTH